MSTCVLDASFTCQWLFQDEASPEGYAALAAIRLGGATVPALWPFEITNVLGISERKGRLTQAGVVEALALLRPLPLQVADPLTLEEAETVLELMRRYRLSGYDATYLSWLCACGCRSRRRTAIYLLPLRRQASPCSG